MYIVTGASGHVGSWVVKSLISEGEEVLAITHSMSHVPKLKLAGTNVEMVDIRDIEKLSQAFSRGKTLFVLNPLGDVSKDSVQLEKETVSCLIQAVSQSTVEKIVVQSTQGAQKGEGIGDFGPLYELEEGLKTTGRAIKVTRAAYYMSNWDMQASTVKSTGVLQSLYPEDLKLPMVAPRDLGEFNAEQMLSDFSGVEIVNVSGPDDYSARDVAHEFSRVYDREVKVEVVPQSKWIEAYKAMGFSDISARSYAEMTRLTQQILENGYAPENLHRTRTSLREYMEETYGRKGLVETITAPLQL